MNYIDALIFVAACITSIVAMSIVVKRAYKRGYEVGVKDGVRKEKAYQDAVDSWNENMEWMDEDEML